MPPLELADLTRPLGHVAQETPEWAAGDHAGGIEQTLLGSARDLHNRAYTFWGWTGSTADGRPALLTPVRAKDALAFRPKGPASVLSRAISAAVWSGAGPRSLSLLDWRGFAGVTDPGMDLELVAEAQREGHEAPARVSIEPIPPGVVLSGAPLALDRLPDTNEAPVARLAHRAGVHPIRAVAALADLGIPEDESSGYGPELLASLLGTEPSEPDPEPVREPSALIDDDPCPRRRQARRLLRRLLGMKKVGAGHHTAFDHIYRGAPADARREAIEVGEALVRAGLLGEKPSVGQRHVYLRREALPEIHALIERGETVDPELARLWSAPAPRLARVTAAPRRSQ